jgi:hypothetical protein
LGIHAAPPFVVARTITKFLIWNIDDGKCNEATLGDAIVTAVYVDNNYAYVGDSSGVVTVVKLSDGQIVHVVNTKMKPVSSGDNDKMGLKLETRVNHIARYGRFLWVAFECSYVAVYDLFSAKQSAPLADFSLKGYSMRSMMVENSMAVVQVVKKTDNDKVQSCNTLVWCPYISTTNVKPFFKIKK